MLDNKQFSNKVNNDQPNSSNKIYISVANRTIVRVIVVIALLIGLFDSLIKLSSILLLFLFAFFLTLALNAPVTKLARRFPGKLRGSRTLATSISFLIVIAILGGFLAYITPPLVHQTEKFINAAPSLLNSVKAKNNGLGLFIRNHHLQNEVNIVSKDITSWLSSAGSKAFSSISAIATSIFSVIAILVLTFMMSIEGPHWLKVIDEYLVPDQYKDNVKELSVQMYGVIKGYVNGQVILAVIAAVVLLPALLVLHISYPIALMVVVFLSGLIPMIGHSIGAVILAAVGLFHSPFAGIVILIYYFGYMLLENYYLQPRIQASTTQMSPLLVLASLLIGVDVGGIFGGLVAIPLAASLRIAIIDIVKYRRQSLEPVKRT